MIIQKKALERFFTVVLVFLIMLYKPGPVFLTFESVDEILISVTIQMKAIE